MFKKAAGEKKLQEGQQVIKMMMKKLKCVTL